MILIMMTETDKRALAKNMVAAQVWAMPQE